MVPRVKSGNRFPSWERSPAAAPNRRKSSRIASPRSPPRRRFQAKPPRRAGFASGDRTKTPRTARDDYGIAPDRLQAVRPELSRAPPESAGLEGERDLAACPLREIHFAVVPLIGVLEIEVLLENHFGIDAHDELDSRPPDLLPGDERRSELEDRRIGKREAEAKGRGKGRSEGRTRIVRETNQTPVRRLLEEARVASLGRGGFRLEILDEGRPGSAAGDRRQEERPGSEGPCIHRRRS